MDLDTFPGDVEVANTLPSNLNALKEEDKEYQLIMDLAHLAIDEYNKESILYKYKFLKIEKLNLRLTGYMEYFMTVKVKNLTLATVYETFQIHTGAHPADFAKRIFSCLPKGGGIAIAIAKPRGGFSRYRSVQIHIKRNLHQLRILNDFITPSVPIYVTHFGLRDSNKCIF
ncbi:hypothetical protein KY284_007623 [Solanum tuberosum]|nr:hypothetical protein KY284_007623 [Solanum tuberosum]